MVGAVHSGMNKVPSCPENVSKIREILFIIELYSVKLLTFSRFENSNIQNLTVFLVKILRFFSNMYQSKHYNLTGKNRFLN
mgnify:CR=1 FL=1